jgi:hypothetical protein
MMVAKPLARCVDEQVKPLQIIWSKFPHQWSAANTVRQIATSHAEGRLATSHVDAEQGLRCGGSCFSRCISMTCRVTSR